MKKAVFLFLVMSIAYIVHAQEGWNLLPFVPSQTLRDVHCVNKDTVLAVGDYGYIVRTINGGIHWDSIYSTTNNDLYKIKFVNNSIGFICGKNGTLLKTENSGLTWTKIEIPTSLNLLNISFINQNTGWIVGGTGIPSFLYGNKGVLLKTNNIGMNWEIDTSYNFTLSSVFFIDKDTGYVSMNNYLLTTIAKTTDGGKSFQFIVCDSLVNAYATDICFITPQTGYYISRCKENDFDKSGIFKTMDYGQTWEKIVKVADIVNAYFFDTCILYYTHFEMPGSGSYYYNICQDYIEEFPYFNGMHLL
ncbi:MAG: YCF48-related protein, partial [Bacteroidales bacterium]|nr:YCF48-related protein [Bacteroidales bacterium]